MAVGTGGFDEWVVLIDEAEPGILGDNPTDDIEEAQFGDWLLLLLLLLLSLGEAGTRGRFTGLDSMLAAGLDDVEAAVDVDVLIRFEELQCCV